MVEPFKVTVTPDGSGSAQLAAADVKVQTARRPWDAFSGTVKAVGAVSDQLQQDTATQDMLEGSTRAAELLAEIGTMSAEDRAARLTQERNLIASGESEFNEVNNKAFLSAINATYFSSMQQAQAESNMRNASVVVDSLVIPDMLPDEYDKTKAFDWISKEWDVDVATVRNMYLSKQTDYFSGQLMLQTTRDGVAMIEEQIQANKKSLEGSTFYGSRSEDWKRAIATSNSQLKTARTAALKNIKDAAKGRIAEAEGNKSSSFTSYLQPLVAVKNDFVEAYGDDKVVLNNKLNEYQSKVEEAQTSREWQSAYKPGDIHGVLPDNKMLKTEWKKKTKDTFLAAFARDDLDTFINIGVNEPEFVKDAGTELMTTFRHIEDGATLQNFVNKIELIRSQPKGAMALRQALGDDNFAEIIATNYYSKTGYAADIKGARNKYELDKANIGVLPRSSKLNAEITEYVSKLGTQGEAFYSVITRMPPHVAEEEIENVAQFFKEQVEEKDGVIIDTSMAIKEDNVSLDKDRTHKSVMEKLAKDVSGSVDKVVVIGDVAVATNNATGEVSLVSISKEAEKVNGHIIDERKREQMAEEEERGTITGDVKRAVQTGGEVLVGQVPAAFAEFGGDAAEAVGNILSRLGGHIWDNTMKDVQAFKDFLGIVDRPEAKEEVIDEFDKIIEETITENPLSNVARPTLSGSLADTLKYKLQSNKHKVEMAKKLKEEVIKSTEKEVTDEQPITTTTDTPTTPVGKVTAPQVTPLDKMITTVITNEAGYQAQKADSGNYYKGKLIGTKYGISAPILAKHLKRAPTVDDMKNLTVDTARKIYHEYYGKMGIDQLPDSLQEAVVDLSAPAPSTVAKVLQKMAGAKVDGVMGPNTAKAVAKAGITKEAFGLELQKELRRINRDKIVKQGKHKGKTRWAVYGKGWTNRINHMTGNSIQYTE